MPMPWTTAQLLDGHVRLVTAVFFSMMVERSKFGAYEYHRSLGFQNI
jgi:hypothetical protein